MQVGNERWGQGVCAGDIDNDGFEDIYVTNFGMNRLYRNIARHVQRHRRRARASPSIAGPRAAHLATYDGDGCLDLFVAGYVASTSISIRRLRPDDAPASTGRGICADWRARRHGRLVLHQAPPSAPIAASA